MKHVSIAPDLEKDAAHVSVAPVENQAHVAQYDAPPHDGQSMHSFSASEKGSFASHGAEGEAFAKERARAERRLLLKLDLGIMPFAVLLYLSAYLDRGNMANARLAGLEKSVLNNNDTNYSIALACFFITYILLSIPGTLMAKAVLPSRSIAAGALVWSIAATAQAAVTNRAGLFVCRLFIGAGEAFFGQAMALHLSFWYTKRDLAKRVGFFISAGAVAGAFGGLIAYGVTSIQNASIANWRILFLVEGCPALLLAIAVALFMPTRPEVSRYLTEDERTLCLTRLNAQRSEPTGIQWAGVRRALTDWKMYTIALMYSCMNLTLGSVGGFLPTIIKDGFGYSAAQAQLMTVPPYAVALVFMLLLTTFSDWRQARGIPAAAVFALGIIGWAVLMSVPAAHATAAEFSARYLACILIVTAGYTNIPIIIAWTASNAPNESQRAASLGLLNSVGQCLSVAAAFLFPKSEGPTYAKGSSINLAFQCLGLVLALGMTAYYRCENSRRARDAEGEAEYEDESEDRFDRAPRFRYTT